MDLLNYRLLLSEREDNLLNSIEKNDKCLNITKAFLKIFKSKFHNVARFLRNSAASKSKVAQK